MRTKIVNLFKSYDFFLWFMRTMTLPIAVASFWMANDSYDKFSANPNLDGLLGIFVGLLGGAICACYFLVAWLVGKALHKEKDDG